MEHGSGTTKEIHGTGRGEVRHGVLAGRRSPGGVLMETWAENDGASRLESGLAEKGKTTFGLWEKHPLTVGTVIQSLGK